VPESSSLIGRWIVYPRPRSLVSLPAPRLAGQMKRSYERPKRRQNARPCAPEDFYDVSNEHSEKASIVPPGTSPATVHDASRPTGWQMDAQTSPRCGGPGCWSGSSSIAKGG
jgi:hypothetical protein